MNLESYVISNPPAYDFANAANDAWMQETLRPLRSVVDANSHTLVIKAADAEAEPIATAWQRLLGTQGPSTWLDPAATILPLQYATAEYSLIPGVSISFYPFRQEAPRRSPAQEALADIRRISGLSVQRLASLFPVQHGQTWRPISEKGIYRWASGEVDPSEGNLHRLLSFRSFFRALSARVGNVKAWLLTPTRSGAVPFDVLRAGHLTRALELASELPIQPGQQVYDSEGTPGIHLADIPFDRRGSQEDYLEDSADDWDDE